MIRLLEKGDYSTWLELAKEVEPLFGPMTDSEDFCEGIKACIDNKNAYGIEHTNKNLAGIIALNREKNEILWLAVGKKYRGNNYGEKLVKKAIKELEINGDIYVQTFSENIKEGKGARTIYERNGFSDIKSVGKNPAGIETVIMKKISRFSKKDSQSL